MRRKNILSGITLVAAIGVATIACKDKHKDDVKPTPPPEVKENTYSFEYGETKVDGTVRGALVKMSKDIGVKDKYALEITSPKNRLEVFEITMPLDSLRMDKVLSGTGRLRFSRTGITDVVDTVFVAIKVKLDTTGTKGQLSFKGAFSDTTSAQVKNRITKGLFFVKATKE